eukprot:scaffold433_cov257-Pinguiococcus_pyrenoidosus.AAC.24
MYEGKSRTYTLWLTAGLGSSMGPYKGFASIAAARQHAHGTAASFLHLHHEDRHPMRGSGLRDTSKVFLCADPGQGEALLLASLRRRSTRSSSNQVEELWVVLRIVLSGLPQVVGADTHRPQHGRQLHPFDEASCG